MGGSSSKEDNNNSSISSFKKTKNKKKMPMPQQYQQEEYEIDIQMPQQFQQQQYQQNIQMPQQYQQGPNQYQARASTNPHEDWSNSEDILKNVKPPTTQTGEKLEIDLDKCLEFTVNLGSEKVKALTKEQLLPLLLNIKETNFDKMEIEIDSKIDLVCVIDISGSMSGSKLDYVKQTMHTLLEVLGEGHRIAIVLFDDYSREYMNFKVINKENKEKIKEVIDSIQDEGCTNITAGVHSAQDMLGKRETKNHVSTVFLLSDGAHNSGPISMDILYNGEFEKAKCEYTLTCFGYGDDHDANLLQEMSERKGGNYYFVNDISKVEECFLDCLGMVTSVLGQNIVVDFDLIPTKIIPEIRFHKTFGPYWNSISPIKNQIKLNSFYSGFNKNFIAQLAINPIKQGSITEETEIIIGEVKFEIDSIGENPVKKTYNRTLKLKLIPENSTEDIKENIDVQKQLTRVVGADIIEVAQELNDAGKHDEAMDVIKNFTDDLEMKSYNQEDLFVNMGENLKKQSEMIKNNKEGKRNAYKSINFTKQTKNIYMNECSAPMFSKSLYQNKKQKKMSKY